MTSADDKSMGDSVPARPDALERIRSAWHCPIGHQPSVTGIESVRWVNSVGTCVLCGQTSRGTPLDVAHLAASREMAKRGGCTLRHAIGVALAATSPEAQEVNP